MRKFFILSILSLLVGKKVRIGQAFVVKKVNNKVILQTVLLEEDYTKFSMQ